MAHEGRSDARAEVATPAVVGEVAALRDRLVRQLTRYCGDGDLAEEIAQDTLLAALRHGDRLDQIEHLWSWLWRVARNRVHSHHRHRSVVRRAEPRLHVVPDTTDDGDRLVVLELVAGLPATQREVLWLRHVEDRSVAETARLLGCREGTVKSISHRALARLRAQLVA